MIQAGNSVSSVETLDDDSIVIRFPSRAAAEQVCIHIAFV